MKKKVNTQRRQRGDKAIFCVNDLIRKTLGMAMAVADRTTAIGQSHVNIFIKAVHVRNNPLNTNHMLESHFEKKWQFG